MREVKRLLENWGMWARCRLGTEFPPVAAGMMEAVEWESRDYRGEWNDDIALAVDRAVAELGQFDSELRKLMLQHYVGNASARYLARVIGVHHVKVSRNIERGDMWVAAMLFPCIRLTA